MAYQPKLIFGCKMLSVALSMLLLTSLCLIQSFLLLTWVIMFTTFQHLRGGILSVHGCGKRMASLIGSNVNLLHSCMSVNKSTERYAFGL